MLQVGACVFAILILGKCALQRGIELLLVWLRFWVAALALVRVSSILGISCRDLYVRQEIVDASGGGVELLSSLADIREDCLTSAAVAGSSSKRPAVPFPFRTSSTTPFTFLMVPSAVLRVRGGVKRGVKAAAYIFHGALQGGEGGARLVDDALGLLQHLG